MYQKLERTLTTGHVNKITCESWVSLTEDKVMTVITETVIRDHTELFNEVRFVMNGTIGNDQTTREQILSDIEDAFVSAPSIRDYQRLSLDYDHIRKALDGNQHSYEVDQAQCFIASPEKFQLGISDVDYDTEDEDENPDYDLPKDQRQY